MQASRHCYYSLADFLYNIDAESFLPRALLWAAVWGRVEIADRAVQAGTSITVVCGTDLTFRLAGERVHLLGGMTPLL